MVVLIAKWFVSAVSLLVVAHVVPGFTVTSFGTALVAAVVVGLINSTLGLVLKIITFPLTLLTFGLFLFVINGLVLMLASGLVGGFQVEGFLPAFVGAIVLSVVHAALSLLVFDEL